MQRLIVRAHAVVGGTGRRACLPRKLNLCMERKKRSHDLLTASEVVEEYREIVEFLKWDRRMIGVFCQGNLVVSRYDKTLKEWLVRRDSLEALIEYVKGTFQQALQKHGK